MAKEKEINERSPCEVCILNPTCDEMCEDFPVHVLLQKIWPEKVYHRILNHIEKTIEDDKQIQPAPNVVFHYSDSVGPAIFLTHKDKHQNHIPEIISRVRPETPVEFSWSLPKEMKSNRPFVRKLLYGERIEIMEGMTPEIKENVVNDKTKGGDITSFDRENDILTQSVSEMGKDMFRGRMKCGDLTFFYITNEILLFHDADRNTCILSPMIFEKSRADGEHRSSHKVNYIDFWYQRTAVENFGGIRVSMDGIRLDNDNPNIPKYILLKECEWESKTRPVRVISRANITICKEDRKIVLSFSGTMRSQ